MLWDLFASVVARQPDAPALSMGVQALTYAQLEAKARSLVARLRQVGCRRGDVVAVFLPNHFEFASSVLAIMHEGGVCLPLSVKYMEVELGKYLRDAKPRVILAESARHETLAKICGDLPEPPPVMVDPSEVTLDPVEERAGACTGDEPFLWQYSTGSTGQSKSVQRSYRQVMAEVAHYREALRVQPSDRIMGAVPLFHSHGFGNCLLGTLMNGASLELVENFNPREVQKILSEKKVTIFPGVPFIFKMLAALKSPGGVSLDFSSLRLCFSAGAPLDVEISTNFEQAYGQPVRQLYGTTETGSISINLAPDLSDTLEGVGLPMNGVEVSIRDEEGKELSDGSIGEIWIRSPAMAPGYLNNAEATLKHFHEGWFAPGDLAVRDRQGRISIRGRKTLFINVGGNKVDPAEVEKFLLSFPKITDAAVLGHPTVYGGQLVKAFVVASGEVEKEALVAYCQTGLAEFKVPKIVEFRSEIPRSPLGKILRKYLQD